MNVRALLIAAVLADALTVGRARAQVSPTIDSNQITQAEALTLAQAAIQACKSRGMSVNVQVADADGHLRIALASENATLAGLDTAPRKIASVLAFHTSTRALQARWRTIRASPHNMGRTRATTFRLAACRSTRPANS